jgi:hypothetical protein
MSDPVAHTLVEGSVATPASEGSQAATIPTLIVSAEEAAIREAAKRREPAQVISKPQMEIAIPSRRRSPMIIIGAVIALLIVVGAGAYAITKFMKGRTTNTPSTTATTTGPDLSLPRHEVGRYWLELEAAANANDSVRAGDLVELQSGQRFKFHFSPNDNGYIYLLGPGANNAPAIFLSEQPTPGSGLHTNQVSSGVDFSFPDDSESQANFMKLNNTPGTDEFTFVFSPVSINSPAFFAGPSEHYLTKEELKEWTDFQAQAKANAATTEVIKAAKSPQVAVRVPQNGPENASVVFRVRIQHK